MFTKNGLRQHYDWAAESFDILFAHCRGFSEAELLQEHDGFGQKSLWETLLHIVGVENYWLYMLSGKLAVEDYPKEKSVAELDEHRKLVGTALRAYIESKSDTELNAAVTFHGDATEQPITQSPAFALQHIITHSYHHKGQAVAQCRLLGRPAPDTDMLRWLPA